MDQSEDVEKEQRDTTKPCVSLNSCVMRSSAEQWEEKSIPAHAMQAASGIFDREEETGKDDETSREREGKGALWRPAPLPVVVRQLSTLPLLQTFFLPSDLPLFGPVVLFCQTTNLL